MDSEKPGTYHNGNYSIRLIGPPSFLPVISSRGVAALAQPFLLRMQGVVWLVDALWDNAGTAPPPQHPPISPPSGVGLY